ncbi:MAG: hypothetical protein U0168_16985 [Nannocystaceae bacterium]
MPPVLERKGSKVALSMPDLDADMVAMIVEEVLDLDQRAQLGGGITVEAEYRAADGRRFHVLADRPQGHSGVRLTFRPVTEVGRAGAAAPRPGARAPELVAHAAAATPAHATAPLHAAAPVHAATPVHAVAVASPIREGLGHAITQALAQAEAQHASDVLIASGHAVRLRVGGHLVEPSRW